MSGKEGYSPIPDVEERAATTSGGRRAITKRYPEANEMEESFLKALDDAIENAKPKIKLPKINVRDVGPALSPLEFLESLKYPSVALVVTVASALVAIFWENPVVTAVFPYYACILTYLSSVPAMADRLDRQAMVALSAIDAAKSRAEEEVDGVSDAALRYVDSAERTMDGAIAPIKKKLEFATELEKALRVIDPDINIPDTTDIERAFDGFSDAVAGAIGKAKGAVDVSRRIPKPLHSRELFKTYVIAPILAIFLVLQLLAVYFSSWSLSADDPTSQSAAPGLRGLSHRLVLQTTVDSMADGNETAVISETVDAGNVTDVIPINDDKESYDEHFFGPIFDAIQTYFGIVIQLAIMFIISSTAAIATYLNKSIETIENDVNATLDEKAGPVYRSVFQDGFSSAKEMLKLIHQMEKIEGPLRKLEKTNAGSMLAKGAGNFAGSAVDEAKDMAKGAADKAGDIAEDAAEFAKSVTESAKGFFKKFG